MVWGKTYWNVKKEECGECERRKGLRNTVTYLSLLGMLLLDAFCLLVTTALDVNDLKVSLNVERESFMA